MNDHRTRREIIFVPYPVPTAGADWRKEVKPLPFQRNQPTHWRPQRAIPSKGAATVNLLRCMVEQEAAMRQMLKPQPQR
jgi:hypothetical protein